MEEQILQFLEDNAGIYYSTKLVSKIIDREQYRSDNDWAQPYLDHLYGMKKIIHDADGFCFRSLEWWN